MEKDEFVSKYEWMVRDCELYKDEYKDCKGIKGRWHQKFVYGQFIDCSQWKRDHDNCIRWEEDKDFRSFKELIVSENERRKERLKNHYANDVWERRTEPPDNWNAPLPPFMEERLKSTYLAAKSQEMKEGGVEKNRTLCTIL